MSRSRFIPAFLTFLTIAISNCFICEIHQMRSRKQQYRYIMQRSYPFAVYKSPTKFLTKIVSSQGGFHLMNMFHMFQTVSADGDDNDDDDEFLAEILAEEQREAEELEKLEAEMRELDELKSQHEQMKRDQDTNRMKPGGRSNRMGGGGGNSNNGQRQKQNPNPNLKDIEQELNEKEVKKAADKQAQQQADEEKLAAKRAQEIARQREAAYLAELERISDENARKALQRQKRRDGQAVKRILRNSANGRHYAVLGMKCKWGEIKIGPLTLCNVTPGDIKRAYRIAAKNVHPDKNRDGRAGEAFDALEKSSAVLLDEKLKGEYDAKIRKLRKETIKKFIAMMRSMVRSLKRIFKMLGPFAMPVSILIALAV